MNKEEKQYLTFNLNEKTSPYDLYEFIISNLYFYQVMDLYKLLKEEIEILRGENND